MTLIEAQKILGLSDVYTENDVNEAYKKLARDYHPDNFVACSEEEKRKAEEFTKQINEAKELLKNNNVNYIRKASLVKLKFYYVDDALNYGTDLDFIYLRYKAYINKKVNYYEEKIKKENNLQKINKLLEKARDDLKQVYIMFRNEVLKFWGIDVSFKDYYYQCSLKEFLRQLEELKKSNDLHIMQLIKDYSFQYELWPHYKFLKKKIDKIIDSFIVQALSNNGEDIQNIKIKMGEQIRSLFDFHVKIITSFNRIEGYFNKLLGENAIEKIVNGKLVVLPKLKSVACAFSSCKNDYELGIIFYECEERLKRIEGNLVLVQKELKILSNRNIMQDIFSLLSERFYKVLQKSNEALNGDFINGAVLVFQRFMGVYNAVIKEDVEVINVDTLREITFENFLEDNILLDNMVIEQSEKKDLKLYICFKDKLIYGVKEEDGENVALISYAWDQLNEIRLSKKEMAENFVSLDSFLAEATFIGERNVGFRYDALFRWKSYILIRDDESVEKYSIISDVDYFNYGAEKIYSRFKDKDVVKDDILKVYGALLLNGVRCAR